MNTYEIGALTIGLSIVFLVSLLTLLSGTIKSFNSFSDEWQFKAKKWVFIVGLILVNIAGCVMVYYTQNLQVLLYVVIVLKLKDILMSIMFLGNTVYKFFEKLLKKKDLGSQFDVSDEFEKILCFIPAYKETTDDVAKTVDSVLNNKVGQHYMVTCIISDGFANYSSLMDTVLLEKSYYYNSWKGEENIPVKVYYGKRNSKPVVLITKIKNLGKKDSILLCNDLFNYKRTNMDSLMDSFRHEVSKDFSKVFNATSVFDYIFTTDADTRLEDNVILELMKSIKNRKAIAGCGVVNIESSESSSLYWTKLQNFQYLYGQYLRRTNEDLFSQVLCLPGCVSMFKVVPESNNSLEMYSQLPDKTKLVESCIQYIGTDRRYTSCLIYNQDEGIVMNSNVHAYTKPPQTWSSFVQQRKRWCSNMYFNNMFNIVGPNVNFLLRFFNVVEFLRMSLVYFRLFNSFYFVFLLASTPFSYSILELVPLVVLVSFPVVCFLVYSLVNFHLRKMFVSLFFGYLLNKISTFFINPVVFSSMLWNIGNSKW